MHILLKRERKLDTEFDQVVLQTIDTTHPEDFNTLKFFWETFSKE